MRATAFVQGRRQFLVSSRALETWTKSISSNKLTTSCKIVDFGVPVDHRIKLKECEKRDKNLDLARELKKLWNKKVTIIPIVIGAFGTVTKGLLKGLEDLEVGREWRPSKQQHY